MVTRKWFYLSLALMGLMVLVSAAAAQESAKSDANEPGSLKSIESLQVKFKLDTATTKSLYMGEVWAAPAKFTGAQAGRMFKAEARAVGLDSLGQEVQDVEAAWKSADPNVVRISPATGKRVKFIVVKPGEGTVQVSYGNFIRKLDVKAAYKAGVMQVEIAQ